MPTKAELAVFSAKAAESSELSKNAAAPPAKAKEEAKATQAKNESGDKKTKQTDKPEAGGKKAKQDKGGKGDAGWYMY